MVASRKRIRIDTMHDGNVRTSHGKKMIATKKTARALRTLSPCGERCHACLVPDALLQPRNATLSLRE